MAEMMDVKVLGIVENMSYITCPHCGDKIYPYGKSKLEDIAMQYSIPVLGRLPIDEKLSKVVDEGRIEEVDGDPLEGAVTVITGR
jgi:Mrp family chromosome partitioning ATPase